MNTTDRICKMNTILKVDNNFMEYLKDNKFFTQPASTKYHGSYKGGLFEHSYNVAMVLRKLTVDNNLEWQRNESPEIIGLFHDLCKTDSYIWNDEVCEYEYNEDVLLKGHGEKSVMLLSQHMQLTEEEILCIRYHMGAYNTNEWDLFDKAIKKYPNVLWTHMADMLASKVIED